jgi:integrase
MVDLSGRRAMLRIPAGCQKGNRDTLTAIAPDFYDHLMKTPPAERKGRVFPVTGASGEPLNENKVGRIISDIGEAAGVVVDKAAGKFASAHDLRRSFGSRWSTKVMPAVLKEQMRHRSIQTTMQHYVGQNAEQTADAIWQAAGRVNTFVNCGQKSAQSDDQNGHKNSAAIHSSAAT